VIPTDYHLHSAHSADARTPVHEMCEAALRAGLTDICFTEHVDFDRSDPHYGFLDDEAFSAAVADARDRYAGRLAVRKGVEFDYRRAFGMEPADVLAALDLDFVMGSVHTAAGVQVYGLSAEDFAALDLDELLDEYLAEIEALVQSGWCHCVGHFDYVCKQAPDLVQPLRDTRYWQRVEGILSTCVAGGVALEVNTHHVLDRGMGLAADEEILRRYRRLGGRLVTVGSDAHRPEDIAQAFPEAERALRRAGFTSVTGYDRGRPYAVPLQA